MSKIKTMVIENFLWEESSIVFKILLQCFRNPMVVFLRTKKERLKQKRKGKSKRKTIIMQTKSFSEI